MEYEHRLRLLKEYLNNADAIERIKVAEIFGLGIGKSDRSEESLVLQELSTKVHDLLRENKELKSISKLDLDSNLEYLIKENKKLKMILEEYKSSENSTSNRLKSENYQLKVEIDRLRK
jgi:regulator of replication initiation timing